jgi:NADP-dependent 3-hydroxy acid dehydrogenase YdfG
MTYIIAGATGTTGSAIARELSKSSKIHLIGRSVEKLSTLADEIDATYSTLDLTNPMPTKA